MIISIVLFIWFIKPDYSDMQNKRSELKKNKEILANLMEKEKNIESLAFNLESNTEKEKLVLKYLPQIEKQERFVDTLNFLANDSQLAVASINIEKNSIARAAVGISNKAGVTNSDEETIMPPLLSSSVSVSVIGNYENIKNYIQQLYSMEYMSNINYFSISSLPSEKKEGEEEAVAGSGTSLKADIKIDFDYLLSPNLIDNFNNPIFSSNSFNFSDVDILKERLARGKVIPEIIVDMKGRPNPFLSP